MSTIEKAVEKLERKLAASEQAREPALDANGKETVEKVVRTNSATAQPAAPARAGPEAGQVPVPQASRVPIESRSPAISNGRNKVEQRGKGHLPVLELPFGVLQEKGMVTPASPRSRIAEEYRTIKRPLLRNIEGGTASLVDNPNLIMVTSAMQGDGKTFSAINLAMSIAMEQDKTVLFVDADVSKASAGTLLGVPHNSAGLIDLLENKGLTPADVIVPTNVANLRILPAGNIHERSTELLASHSMRKLMLELARRYEDRVIVFDSPPLLLTTEASVLASFMGQIAFVVSTDETPSEAVTEALEKLGDDKIIGMILNKAHHRRNSLFGLGYGYGYGKGYGYGYGYGYGHERRSEAEKSGKAD